MSQPNQFRWTSASRTDVGMVRELNEDACLDRPERGLWAVADGMGGHARGDLASRMVVEALDALPAHDNILKYLNEARRSMQAVNQELRDEAAMRDARVIGSTVVALLACDVSCAFMWAGDSRLYLFRDGTLRLLTRDHSQIEELKARGELNAQEAAGHPARNLITRAVGGADLLDLDEETIPASDGDMFLLCSDGLSNMVSEIDILNALLPGDCEQAAEILVDLALNHGGRDNISVVVVRADDLEGGDTTVLNPAI